MCGIVSYIGKENVIKNIMEGLKKLEYRGYDSSGIAFVLDDKINIIKKKGEIKNLDKLLDYDVPAKMGISHTRWATHGEASDVNAHPHKQGKITLVHNGIIENYDVLKKKLIKDGYKFITETDTEVAAALIDKLYKDKKDMLLALKEANNILKGSYAFNIINDDYSDEIFGLRKDSPLVIGKGKKGNMLASDIIALTECDKYALLNNYDTVVISEDEIKLYDKDLKMKKIDYKDIDIDDEMISKNGFDHFMLKEINEEEEIVKNLLSKYIKDDKVIDFFDIEKYDNIDIVACGSASFAGYIGKYFLEKYKGIKTNVYFASEYRYQKNIYHGKTLIILISQSGETADTLAVLPLAKEHNIDTLGIVNRRESRLAREADYVIFTDAGIEVSVATTKAYLAQVLILVLLSIKGLDKEKEYIHDLHILPSLINKYINSYDYKELAKIIKEKTNIFYLGRGIDYYLCMEGSLKLKEISYIHSEAFQAGELKHGSISLIDEEFGVISVVTDKSISDKTISNLKEVSSRGAKIISITNIKDNNFADYEIIIDDYSDFINPLLVIVPMQLLAYYTALSKGLNIDKPKNLAKSVTVE